MAQPDPICDTPAIVYDFDWKCSYCGLSYKGTHAEVLGHEQSCPHKPATVPASAASSIMDYDFFGDSLADPMVTSPPLS